MPLGLRLLPPVLAVLLVLPMLVPTTADAATGRTLHVDAVDGTDPSSSRCLHPAGTAERPWRTLSIALRCLEAGDTLHVHEGTYRERVTFGGTSGTEQAPIVVTAAPGEARPVIQGSLRIEDPTWWTIQDLEFVGDGQDYGDGAHPLKILGGSHWTVRRVEVHHAAAYALFRITPTSDGRPPSHWRVLDSCLHDTIPANGSPDEPPYTDHNMYVWTGEGAGPGLIEGNVMFGAPNGQNIKLGNVDGAGANDGADRVTVRHNTLVGAAQNITVVGPSDDNLIEKNILAEVGGEPWYPNVRGIHLRGHGNVARDNAWSGAPEVVRNQTNVTTGVVDGGNQPVTAGFESRGCDGFLPSDPAAAAFGAHAQDVGDVDIPVDRVAGADRVETALRVSQATYGRSSTVLVARADAYPDALASAALAGLHRAPVLLVPPDHVPSMVLKELARLGADRTVLLGGAAALTAGVVDDLERAGLEVDRIAGSSRFSTAARVADEVHRVREAGRAAAIATTRTEAILVEGANADPNRGWPDAVSAGQLAATSGSPVLLTMSDTLPDETRQWLAGARPDVVTIVGGTAAVSRAVAEEVARYAGTVRRLAGPDRFATSEVVADELSSRHGSATPMARTFVASGLSFADALAVGPATAVTDGTLVLYGGGEAAYERLRDFVAPVDDEDLHVTVVGGPAAVPGSLELRWKIDAMDTSG